MLFLKQKKSQASYDSMANAPKQETPLEKPVLISNSLPKTETNPNSFFENITLNKPGSKPNGFTVEFAKEKPQFGTGKGTLQAKKIANFDIGNLTLEESESKPTKSTPSFNMTDTQIATSPGLPNKNSNSSVKEVVHKTGNTASGYKDRDTEESFKKFENAKSISSEAFHGPDKSQDSMDYKKFNGATAISSAQVFGYEEEDNLSGSGENFKDMFTKVGGKLKEKAGNLLSKLKNDWEST